MRPLTAPAVDWKVIARFVAGGPLVMLLPIVVAGRCDWWQGWAFAVATFFVSLVSRYRVYRVSPGLIAERARFTGSEGVKSWDRWISVTVGVAGPVAAMVVAGLDKRFAWSPDLLPLLTVAAFLLFLAGSLISTRAMLANPFFSSVVRIQKDRGQTVVSAGPYAVVRHPGYAGGLLVWLAVPLMLGTVTAFIPVAVIIVLFVVRTGLEDRTLRAELPGYEAYARRTRYRLLPGIW